MSGTFWKDTDVIVRTPEQHITETVPAGTASTVLSAIGHTLLA